MVTFKRLALTDFKIDIPRLAKKKVLTAALEDSGAELLHAQLPCALPWPESSCMALHLSECRYQLLLSLCAHAPAHACAQHRSYSVP